MAKTVGKAKRDAQTLPPERFNRLSEPDKLEVYGLTTPEEPERYRLRQTLQHINLERSKPFQRLPLAEQDRLRSRMNEIRGH